MSAAPAITIERASPRDAGEIAALYLASDLSSFVTGATLSINGGKYLA